MHYLIEQQKVPGALHNPSLDMNIFELGGIIKEVSQDFVALAERKKQQIW